MLNQPWATIVVTVRRYCLYSSASLATQLNLLLASNVQYTIGFSNLGNTVFYPTARRTEMSNKTSSEKSTLVPLAVLPRPNMAPGIKA